jgi:hypothetical protein
MDNFVAGTGGGTTLAACLASVGNTTPVTGPQPSPLFLDPATGEPGTDRAHHAARS